MNLYVATKWSRRAEAAALMAKLRAEGHIITHDWTTLEDAPPNEARYFAQCARFDVAGVKGADALILLHDANARGAYWEAGEAHARGIPIIVVGAGPLDPVNATPIFYYLPELVHIATTDELDRVLPVIEALRMR